MDLLILPSLFLAGFSNQALELFKKFGLWLFKCNYSYDLRTFELTASLFCVIFLPTALTLLLILLYVDGIPPMVKMHSFFLGLVYI